MQLGLKILIDMYMETFQDGEKQGELRGPCSTVRLHLKIKQEDRNDGYLQREEVPGEGLYPSFVSPAVLKEAADKKQLRKKGFSWFTAPC